MFSARGGFLTAVVTLKNWYDYTASEVNTALSSWVSSGTPTLTSFNTSASHTSLTSGPYRVGVQGADGKIYYAPNAATGNILVVDPANNTSSIQSFGVSGLTLNAASYLTGALAPNGKIYYPPLNTNLALIIDPATNTSVRTNWGLTFSGSNLYDNAVLGGDGKIYCVGAPGCLVIDPVANTASVQNFGGVIPSGASFRWRGAVRSTANGKLYFAPYLTTTVLSIDTTANVANSWNYGTTIGTQAHQGIFNGKDGRLYCSPHNQAYWSIINPIANTYARVSQTSAKSMGGFTGDDGNVYAVPFEQSSNSRFSVFNVTANTVSLQNYGISLGAATNKWWGAVVGPNGKGYCVPDTGSSGNTHILVLDPNGSGTNDSAFGDYTKTSFFNKGSV
jgi:hypothetical protein